MILSVLTATYVFIFISLSQQIFFLLLGAICFVRVLTIQISITQKYSEIITINVDGANDGIERLINSNLP